MEKQQLPEGDKLNLGCGPVHAAGWVNIDGSNRAYLSSRLNWIDALLVRFGLIPPTEFGKETTYHNLFQKLPYPENSAACIYAGELWEHFEYSDALNLTKECYRALKPEGVLRVRVPDSPVFWEKYLHLYRKEMSKPRGERKSGAIIEHTQLFFNDICTKKIYLGSMGHTHKWVFDEVQLIEMFEMSGFVCVERMQFRKSRIPDIERVEVSDFLIVEGIKPPGV